MKQGFTLIELLVVVLIIGILSAVALPQYTTAVERSRATEALTLMNAVSESMQRYHSQHDAWPTSFSQLDVEIPASGKYFTVTMSNSGGAGSVQAVSNRTNHKYGLWTTITANADGTYATSRRCGEVEGEGGWDNDAVAYCNAISGGSPNNF